MKFNCYHIGDPANGIPGASATVELSMGDEDQAERVQQVKESLRTCFESIWDNRVEVQTQEECDAASAAFDREMALKLDTEDKKYDFTPVYKETSSGHIWGYFTPKEN